MRSRNLCVLAIVAVLCFGLNGAATAETVYDHFPGDALNYGDTGKWTVFYGASPSVASSVVTINNSGILSTGTWSFGDTVNFTMGSGTTGVNGSMFGLDDGAAQQYALVRNDWNGYWEFHVRREATSGNYFSGNLNHTPALGDVYSIKYNADSITLALNGTVIATDTDVLLSGPLKVKMLSYTGGTYVAVDKVSTGAIPEPSTLALLVTGLLGLLAYAWRKRR